MSSITISLFKVVTDGLLNFSGDDHKVFKGGNRLNGIIRHTQAGNVGVIIDNRKIFRFTLDKLGNVDMEVRLSEHIIFINTENSMRIFTANSVLIDYPVVAQVNHPISDTCFWVEFLNAHYSIVEDFQSASCQ